MVQQNIEIAVTVRCFSCICSISTHNFLIKFLGMYCSCATARKSRIRCTLGLISSYSLLTFVFEIITLAFSSSISSVNYVFEIVPPIGHED
jgi:hypothetical protein